MPGLGTLVNVVGVIAGGVLGMVCGKKINENAREQLMRVLGLCVIFIGVAGSLSKMLVLNSEGQLDTYGTMLTVISLVIGSLLGEFIKIEDLLEKFGEGLKQKFKAQNDNQFTAAFVNSSLVVCVGAMAVVGAIQDGLTGDHTVLFAKALLDFLIILIMSSTLGIGCAFAAIPIAILQGFTTALASVCEPILSIGSLISDLSMVGSVMIFCVGINLTFGKRFKVGNMLPALLVSMIYSAVEYYL